MVGHSNALSDAKARLEENRRILTDQTLDRRSEAATEARLERDVDEQADFRQAMISSEGANPDDNDASMGGGKIARQDGAAKIRDRVRRHEEARKAERSGQSAVIRNILALQNMKDYLGNLIDDLDERISEIDQVFEFLDSLDLDNPYDAHGNLTPDIAQALRDAQTYFEEHGVDYEIDRDDAEGIRLAIETYRRHLNDELEDVERDRDIAVDAHEVLEELIELEQTHHTIHNPSDDQITAYETERAHLIERFIDQYTQMGERRRRELKAECDDEQSPELHDIIQIMDDIDERLRNSYADIVQPSDNGRNDNETNTDEQEDQVKLENPVSSPTVSLGFR